MLQYVFDVIYDIFKDFLMMPITFIIGLLTIKIKNDIFVSSYKKKLKLKNNALTLNCFTANPNSHDNNEYVNLGYVFEYMSVGEIRSTWSKYYKNFAMNVQMSDLNYDNVRKKHLSSDLLLIGGPFHNQVTKELLFNTNSSLPFSFDDDASLVYTSEDGQQKKYTPILSKGTNQYFESDYALIVNVRNPLNTEKRLIAIIGCRSVGCYGGAVFLSKYMSKIKNKNLSDEYAIVIKCDGEEEDIVSDPELVDVVNLNFTQKSSN